MFCSSRTCTRYPSRYGPESPKPDKGKPVVYIGLILMAAGTLLFGRLDVFSRAGHIGLLLFSAGLVVGSFLPLVLNAKRYALYAVLSFCCESFIIVGAVVFALFPLNDGGWRLSLAHYLGRTHPGTTVFVIVVMGVLIWRLKKWNLFGYGCLEITFAAASA
jgi:hypothetical protein